MRRNTNCKILFYAAVDAKIQPESAVTFESVPATKLLDTSVNRAKAQLAANSPRRPPTKQRSKVSKKINFSSKTVCMKGSVHLKNLIRESVSD